MFSFVESSFDFSQFLFLFNGGFGLGGDYKFFCFNEKEQLQGLNDCFVGYIEKVYYLEQQNKEIEVEIQVLWQKQVLYVQLGDVYDQEICELCVIFELVNYEKVQVQLDLDYLEEDIYWFKECFEEEVWLCDDIEVVICVLCKDIEEVLLVKVELDKKVQLLQDEVVFLWSNYEEEVVDLLVQIQVLYIIVECKDYLKIDILMVLKEICLQFECYFDQNMYQVEEWFKCCYVKFIEVVE